MHNFFQMTGKLIRRSRRAFLHSMLFVLLLTAIQAYLPLAVRQMLSWVEVEGTVGFLAVCVLAYAALELIANFVSVGWYRMNDRLGGQMLENIRTDLYEAIFRTHYQELMRIGKEKLKNILYMDTINIFSSIALQSITIVSNVLLIVVFLIISAFINPMLTLVLIAAALCGFLISMLSRRPIAKASMMVNQKMKADNQTLNESVDAIELIKTNELSGYFLEKSKKSVWDFIDTATKCDSTLVFLKNLTVEFHQVVSFAIAGFLTMTMQGASAGDLVYYLFVSDFVLDTSRAIEDAVYMLMKNTAAFDNVLKVCSLPQPKGGKELEKINSITFDDVSFSYEKNGVKVLEHKNFTCAQGDVVRIAGGNGAGKSTIFKLIAGLLEADEGRILFNGIPVRELNPSCLKKNICYIDQDEILLNDSVKSYLETVSGSVLTDERLAELKRSVCLDDSVCEIAENGHSLSGGQRKKLLMLKLLLQCETASVILIDEIEAGLDKETQELLCGLEQEIFARKKDCIILKISHLPQREGHFTRTIEL